jgi:hypothetical protein
VLETAAIDHVGADESAQFEQMVPVTPVACQPGCFQAEHGADRAFANASDEITKSRPVHCPAGRATEILVNHAHVAKAVTTRKVGELVLPPLALAVLLHLHPSGLANVDDSAACERLLW